MNILEINELTKMFGGLKAVNNVSFCVEKGTIFSIIGPNGSGKTTVLNLITGFIDPDSGEILYEKENICRKSPAKIANKGIIRTFQTGSIVSEASVLENVLIGSYRNTKSNFLTGGFNFSSSRNEEKKIKEKAMETLKLLDINHIAGEKAGNLASGTQRIVEVARVLLAEPKLMLLDEPAAGLNDAETSQLGKLIQKVKEDFGITVILIEHHMGVVMDVSDKIIVLNNGQKIAEGNGDEISTNHKVIEVYLGGGVHSA